MSMPDYTRRDFLKVVGLGAATVAITRCTSAAEEVSSRRQMDKPNIFIIIADDQTWLDSGCYGNKEVKTPNIDRLASEGMRFTRAFTATAMCAPTRQQLYTGIFPVRNGAYPNHSQVYPGTRSIVHYLKDLGYRVGLAGKTHFGPAESFPFEKVKWDSHDFKGVGEFITCDKNQPFCIIVASHSPHLPWKAGDASVYEPEKLTVPAYLADTPETRQALSKYYAEVTDFDREVGECMKLVRKGGLQENTLFIYTSEQGAQFPHCKWTCYDTGIHVAFVVRWPGRIKAGSVSDAMIQYVDVTPTLIDAAGGRSINGLDGRSFLGVLLGKSDKHNDVVYGVHTTRGIIAGSECYPVRSIRTETHKYIMNLNAKTAFRNTLIVSDKENYWRSWVEKAKTDAKAAKLVEMYQHRPAEELYDVVKDPYELDNLAGRAEYRALMDSMRKRLKAWMKQQGDEGIETEMKAFERQGKKRREQTKAKKQRKP